MYLFLEDVYASGMPTAEELLRQIRQEVVHSTLTLGSTTTVLLLKILEFSTEGEKLDATFVVPEPIVQLLLLVVVTLPGLVVVVAPLLPVS